MNEDQQMSAEEFAHENEHIFRRLGIPHLYRFAMALGWIALGLITGYVLSLLFFRAIPFLINS